MHTPVTRTTREIKKNNVVLVVNALKALTSATKAELALQTGLSVATCGTVLNALCQSGEVMALTQDVSSGGRPAQRFTCNPAFFSLLSLYVEGTAEESRMVACVTSATGETQEKWDVHFTHLTSAQFTDAIADILARYPAVRAVGIGLPGVIADGVVLNCDIPMFIGLPLTQKLHEQFGLFVEVGNDMNYTAWGFYRNSCPQETAPIAYILQPGGHCTGCGIVINGRVLQGASHFAGEVSELPLSLQAEEPITSQLAKIVMSLVAVINPATVALSGPMLGQASLSAIARQCLEHFPQQHLPQLVYRDSIEQDYLTGITELTLENFQRQRIFTD